MDAPPLLLLSISLGFACVLGSLLLWAPWKKSMVPNGSVVLITGTYPIPRAASGIGRSLAKKLAKSPTVSLILWDTQFDKLQRLAQSLPYTQSIVVQHVDVSSAEEIERAASEIPEGILRRLSHVVGNAGIVNGKDVLSLTNAEVERCMSVNFNQHIHLFKQFNKQLEENKGLFMSVASVAGMIALTRLSDYCASKFALLGWLEGLRLELHKNKSSITVSTVCPFLVDTKMFTGISVKFPANLLLRTLNKQDVSQRMLLAMANREEFLVLPSILRLLPLMWLLPVSIRRLLYGIIQEHRYMDAFMGAPPRINNTQHHKE